ncbi:MAG: hypothetical protein ACKKMR_03680 [Candidatus Nealsonbacteria bacterium]
MSKTIITIIIIIVIAGVGYWIYQSTITPEGLTEMEQACINSGGKISTSLCCKSTGDFPNICLIGPCGCSPENSHQVKVCDCGPDKCFNGSECVSSDEILTLLENLEQETGIDFSEIQPVEFKWVVKVDPKVEEVDIEGKGFEAKRISNGQYDSVESFLIDRGFEKNLYNIADATFVGLVGYKKDQIVCTVSGGATGYKEAEGQWIPPEPDKKDVTVKCGKGSGLTEPLVSTEEAVKKLLAEKYNKKMAEVTINISQETENHVKGGVVFQPGGPENSGMFLAAKENGSWKLVHDGQGAIPCLDIEPYNFPVYMVIECFDEETGKVKDRAGEACINSGGEATTSLCCKATSDYPNLCLVGPCGCSPENSHQVKICDCGENKCFDGEQCIDVSSK